MGFIDARDPRMIGTVDRTRERLMGNGLVYRYRDAGDEIEAWLQSPDIQARLAELAQEEEELAEIRRLEEEAKATTKEVD